MGNANKIKLSGIIKESIVDGTGIRYVIFCQGCIHNCRNCFNPETHSFEGGKEWDIDAIIEDIAKNPLLQGITFSGGDPWEQADKCSIIAESVKKMGLDVWSYTGYKFEYILQNLESRNGWAEFIKHVDILVDGKFEEENKSLLLTFRGSSNQRIVNVQQSLSSGELVICDFDKKNN